MKLRIAQLEAVDAAAEPGAAQPVALDALLELLGREVGMLQRDGRERHEPLGVRRADLGERLVLDLDQLRGHIALGRVPVRVDAERLDVDALRVHRAEALLRVRHEERLGLERAPHERHRGRHRAVRVHVHRLHALAAHHDLAAPPVWAAAARAAGDERGVGHG